MALSLAQVNLVVADLDRSRDFYAHLGFSFQDRTLPSQGVVAWVSTCGPVDLVLHSTGFARWWDPGSPGVSPGATVLDLNVSGRAELDTLVRVLHAAGAQIAKEPEEMPWGQRFAVVTDPDGYRWGLKAPPAP